MAVIRKVGRFVSHIVDFRVDRWIDLRGNRDTAIYFLQLARRLLIIPKSDKTNTFKEVVEEQSLSNAFLKQQSNYYKLISIFFVSLSLLLLVYGVVLIKFSNLMGASMCLTLSLYPLSQAFRYHFWHFQIERKKLGCSFREWLTFLVTKGAKNV